MEIAVARDGLYFDDRHFMTYVLVTRQTMKNIASSAKNFLVSENGSTADEYAIMLALIVIVCISAIKGIGTH